MASGASSRSRRAGGLAYSLKTHQHDSTPKWGALLRVWNRLHDERPSNFDHLKSEPVSFSIFFPLGAAVRRRIVEVVGKIDVPAHLEPFPVFRNGVADPSTGKVANWWVWDGQKEWRVGAITPEQRKMPILQICNDEYLIGLIEQGWTPETDPQ